jgi:hypothetical protein
MSNWRDQILNEFTPNVARLTLVSDPDGLLLEEGVLASIRDRGFELIPFEDHVAFRYAYESKFRSRWDRGEDTDLVVVLRSSSNSLGCLPYDLLQAGRQLSFTLGEIFPNLSYPVLTALDYRYLDAIYEAQEQNTPGILGDNATKDFVLRYVFKIVPELIRKPSDLLQVLLRRHYRSQCIPEMLDERLIQVLRYYGAFDGWPIDKIIRDREAFLTFLQERWIVFLNRSIAQDVANVSHEEKPSSFKYQGPSELPFDHDDIRVFIDNFFLEGLLEAIPFEKSEMLSETWLAIGIKTDSQTNLMRRLDGLLEALKTDIPNENSMHDDWFQFARKWAELLSLALDSNSTLPESASQKIKSIQTKMDATFTSWLKRRYVGLINLSPVPPIMLHHVPRLLSRDIIGKKDNKVALILVDGLSLDQWVVIRKVLTSQRENDFKFRENSVFAWIPTITSVSRQAAFAGKPPIYFPDSIHTTDKEPSLWLQFWMDQGLTQNEIAYAKGLGNGNLGKVEDILDHPKVRVVGLVVDKVDKIMHGMELGTAGMHNQVRQWVSGPFMGQLFDLLLNNGFRVYLTSDHGNIESVGCGRPSERSVADLRGERARIYPDSLLRKQIKDKFPDAIEWPPTGLPENYLPLLASARTAFVRENERLVGHGGASLEEVIVPFVQIDRRQP